MFEGQVETSEHINLQYDYVTCYYHLIGSVKGAMAKQFVCKACGTGGLRDITHTCDQTCSDCMSSLPFVLAGVRITCTDCTRHFRSKSFFAKQVETGEQEKFL
jgi:hypothetical protein